MGKLFWKGKELKTAGDIMEAVTKTQTKEECLEFMEFYRKDCEFADENIGYMLGYYDQETAVRVREWLGPSVNHPIFGNKFPTPEEAFKAGLELGKRAKVE